MKLKQEKLLTAGLTAAVITCCIGNPLPAEASYEFAGGALCKFTCAVKNGEVSQEKASRLYRQVLPDEGSPMSYANHPRLIEASKGVFLIAGGC